MRILIAAHGYPPRQAAGGEALARNTARHLLAAGHAVRVFAMDDANASVSADEDSDAAVCTDDEVDGVAVRRLAVSAAISPGTVREFDNPLVGSALANVIAAFRPDVMHLFSGYRLTASAIDAAAAAHVPVVVTATDFWFLCPLINLLRTTGELCTVPSDVMECVVCLAGKQRRVRWPHQWTGGRSSRAIVATLRRPMLRPASIRRTHNAMLRRRERLAVALSQVGRVITLSRFLGQTLESNGVAAEALVQVPQGVDTASWLPLDDPQPRTSIHIGYIGQVSPHKGIYDLVRGFRALPCGGEVARLVIYCNLDSAWPANRDRLHREIGGDPRIEIMGPFSYNMIRRVHQNIDVLVVPSRWYENLPNVILEAFASGTPVIATNLAGMAELVTDGQNGLLFDVHNVHVLSDCLRRVIEDPGLLNQLRAGIAPTRTTTEEITDLTAIYAAVVNEAAARRGADYREPTAATP